MADRYVQGDTVWLRGSFYNRAGALYDPASGTIVLRLYDSLQAQIGDDIEGTDITRVGTGIYESAVVLPAGHSSLIFEYSGEDAEGLVQLNRYSIGTIFSSPL